MRNQFLCLKCLKCKPLKCIHLKCIDHKFTYCKCKYLKCMHPVFLPMFNLDYCLKAKANLLFYQCWKLDNPPVKAPSDWVEHTSIGKRYYYKKRTRQSSWVKPPKLMTPIESRKPKNLHNLFGPLDRLLIKGVKVKDIKENEDRPVLAMIIDADVSCNP
ncbi:hypothetical protein PVL29_017038 [Vitis rotundifolia]|uniref:WW domain-containing protein n=1 Tax=Vitis rotundifolia TaxID=103349 RepID=A0AA38Z9E6_VITRO|nr:hypothetical protein PVL29_017038 [Vitis rotundifolia]